MRQKKTAVQKIIEGMIRKDVTLVAEAKALATADPATLKTERKKRLAAAAQAPTSKVPWFLADAAENARLVAKAQVEQPAQRAPVVLVVQGIAPPSEWEAKAKAVTEAHERKKLAAIEVTSSDSIEDLVKAAAQKVKG